MHCIGCEPLRLNETTWAVSWCGQVRRHVGSPFTVTVQLSGLGLRPIPCKGNIIRCPFYIELGEALFVLTLARSTRGTYGYISYHGRWLKSPCDSVFECPDECYGRVEGFLGDTRRLHSLAWLQTVSGFAPWIIPIM